LGEASARRVPVGLKRDGRRRRELVRGAVGDGRMERQRRKGKKQQEELRRHPTEKVGLGKWGGTRNFGGNDQHRHQ